MPVTQKTIVTKERLAYYHNKLKVLLDAKGEVKGVSIDGTTYSPDSSGTIVLPDKIAFINVNSDAVTIESRHDDEGGGGISDKISVNFAYQNDTTNPRVILDCSSYDNQADSYVAQRAINLPSKEYVDSVAGSLSTMRFEKVTTLPTTGENGVIYLVPNSGAGQNVYDEYVWVNVGTDADPNYQYELLGTTAVDLDGYIQETDLVEITDAEIDEMFA